MKLIDTHDWDEPQYEYKGIKSTTQRCYQQNKIPNEKNTVIQLYRDEIGKCHSQKKMSGGPAFC